jgi:hypothetical protein
MLYYENLDGVKRHAGEQVPVAQGNRYMGLHICKPCGHIHALAVGLVVFRGYKISTCVVLEEMWEWGCH